VQNAADFGVDSALQIRSGAIQASQRAGKVIGEIIEQNPMLVGGIGLAVGALIASALPRSEVEKGLMGEASADVQKRATDANKSVFVRELLPQDLKLEVEQLARHEALNVARYLAAMVGKAHSRQMDAGVREKWRRDLHSNRSKLLDAPNWLWTSVVELLADHERAYVEHCRAHAAEMA
jgi:Uncharacterized protein conserved in bacteria (DUF2252)